ncbi:MAG: alpha-L-fucosidase [Candidatus Nephrothrix sp. EaCA]|nr:MAG: alpha-L-fucosidase [Candidatus Nephrothrix sp. EaCA]
MLKFWTIFFTVISLQTVAQPYVPSAENLKAREEFQDSKFGMFVHWGASSVLGHGEWVMHNRNIKVKDYMRLIDVFNPQNFNAAEWVSAAKSAGMKYITFITRHHDGFSNWDTQHSDWKITNTPYKKDAFKMLADECHKQGIKIAAYYSLLDWQRNDYHFTTGRTGKGTGRAKEENWNNYIQFMKNQLTELLTNYGEISGVWFDGHWDQLINDSDKQARSAVDWHYDEIYSLIHKLQPQCLILNNHHLTPFSGEDIQGFEKDLPGHNTTGFGGASVSALPLETCDTMNDSWGYNITDTNYKSTKQVIHYLVKAAGFNANLLLNVGPMGDGKIQPEFLDTLKAVGQWTKEYGETIYGTRGGVIPPQPWGTLTKKAGKIYVHVLKRPESDSYIFIPNFKTKIKKAVAFKTKQPLKYKAAEEGVFLYLNQLPSNAVDAIAELDI